jgi:nicotinate-nucleotide pyrophosphorylase (carboxylating)
VTANSLIGRTGWEAIVALALAEDIGTGDITTQATIPAGATAQGAIIAKQAGVVSGVEPAGFVFHRVDPRIVYQAIASDGDEIAVGDTVATVAGPARSVLTGERVALNLLQRLSGVATMTHAYVQAVEGTGAVVVDTRKTTPGLRLLEKAAVRHGGGSNHRFGLADGVLI